MSVTDVCDVSDVVERSEHRSSSCSYDKEWLTTFRLGSCDLPLKITDQHLASVVSQTSLPTQYSQYYTVFRETPTFVFSDNS